METRLKTLFQPQDDENTDKTDTMIIRSRVIEQEHDSNFEMHPALMSNKPTNKKSLYLSKS